MVIFRDLVLPRCKCRIDRTHVCYYHILGGMCHGGRLNVAQSHEKFRPEHYHCTRAFCRLGLFTAVAPNYQDRHGDIPWLLGISVDKTVKTRET